MDWLQVVILAVVQGLTEFLPISSSAHLILVPILTEWPDQGLAFDVALHLGSLAAVLMYFRKDLINMAQSWTSSLVTRQLDADAKLAWAVLLATIPVGLAGLLFKDTIETVLRSPISIAWGLIVFGVVLGWADWRHRGARSEHQMNWKDVALVGIAQAIALFPGVSRSGITMTAGLMIGLSREASSRFSFLLSIPVTVLACALEARELMYSEETIEWGFMIAGIVLSGISAYLCIHYFLAFIKNIGMQPFVAYRLVLGVLLLWIFA
ncbi:MAG TPA: undecaprenyl-diphosphate phosphatase [Pseudomonas xinjiangensis]|uniref:Undecaprenyl-diphosphatase n=2 Tax=root TaxID=1 RepID=A0A7V1BLR7_9GAMM|nr:undecaprenyl-diphosphate phosphatase [Halopseudomonas xinjiangensis]HEC47067.1 undecaprenyl-diphosphate phosphatase [Halopseudomonas xinjiangensis]